VNRMFHVVTVEAFYTFKKFSIDPRYGLLVPKDNVATIEMSACVIEGVSRSRNALIDGKTHGYDWDSGYTCHQLGSGAIVVQLAQPYVISTMRLLLWDCDDRRYSYYVEVSTNQRNWEMVANKCQDPCKSWQTLRFSPLPVVYIRIVGTDNTANEVFHCVHFECPSQLEEDSTPPPAGIEEAKGSGTSTSPNNGSSASVSRSSPIQAPTNTRGNSPSTTAKEQDNAKAVVERVEPSDSSRRQLPPPEAVEDEEPGVFDRFLNEQEIQDRNVSFE